MYQRSLFETNKNIVYYNNKFPEPQYLGAKYNFRKWIADNIPNKDSINRNLYFCIICDLPIH